MGTYPKRKRRKEGRDGPIRALFLVSYTDILQRVRRSISGLKTSHLIYIMTVGEYPNGIMLWQLVPLYKRERSSVYSGLGRVIKAGLMHKEAGVYHLTPQGQAVYNTACKSFAAVWDELTTEVARRAAEKITR